MKLPACRRQRWIAKLLFHASANETSGNVLLAARPGKWTGLGFLTKVVGSTTIEWVSSIHLLSHCILVCTIHLYRKFCSMELRWFEPHRRLPHPPCGLLVLRAYQSYKSPSRRNGTRNTKSRDLLATLPLSSRENWAPL